MRVYVGLFLILVLLACDDRFEYDLPVNKSRMVVNFVSENNQPWTGTLALSWPILEYNFSERGVPGGVLRVYEDGSLIETMNELDNSGDGQQTTLSSSPMPGKTYSIEASSPEYGTATATYIQPLPVPIEEFNIELVGPDPQFDGFPDGNEAIEFRVTFVDPSGEDFYGINVIAAWDSLSLHGQYYPIVFGDPAYKNNGQYDYSYGTLYFNDEYFEGQRVTMTFRAAAQHNSLSDTLHTNPADWYDYHWVTLRNVSKSYYRYLKTIDLQYKAWGDPYAQPVKVETNVKNGFGVVGGYTMTVKGKPFVY